MTRRMTRHMDLMQLQTLMLVLSEAKEQRAEFQQHREEPSSVRDRRRSRGVLEMLKQLVEKLTDELRELANEEREAVQNHQILVRSLTEFSQQPRRS